MADSITQILTQEMATLTSELQQASQQQGLAADASFGYTVNGTTATLTGPDDEAGGSDNFPQQLQAWIEARHIVIHSPDELDRVARFLHWWIQKNGTSQFATSQPASATTGLYTKPVADFRSRLGSRVAEYFKNQILTQTRNILK